MFERPSRTALLIAVVALAAVLISAVGVAMGSVRRAIETRVAGVVGAADLRLRPSGQGATLEASTLDLVRSWPEVEVATGRLNAPLSLRFGRPAWTQQPDGAWTRGVQVFSTSAVGNGIDPVLETRVRDVPLAAGRLPAATNEIVLDAELVTRLSERTRGPGMVATGLALFGSGDLREPLKADNGPERATDAAEAARLNAAAGVAVGDRVQFVRAGRPPVELTVVGVSRQPPLGARPQAFMTVAGLGALQGLDNRLSQIDVVLRADQRERAGAIADERKPSVPQGVLLQTTERITSGLNRNLRANQIGFVLATLMSFIAAGFIIMTGMSTGVTERQRELAVLRCIGATRGQLALAQLFNGAIVGGIGAAIGVPLGVLAAVTMIHYYRDQLQTGATVEVWRAALAFAGAIIAGLVGALWPAWQASRVTPLRALAVRATPPKRRTKALLLAFGLTGALTHLAIFTLVESAEWIFYLYILVGLPFLMLGYFMLGVPAVLGVARVLGPLIERVFALPRSMLRRAIEGTPYRFGFTAGAMMAGLALMVAIWTQGGAAVRDWLGRIAFPDAFAVGLRFNEDTRAALADLPFVQSTSAIALQTVDTDFFGVRGVTRLKTYFVAFEPESFLRLTALEWIQGDPVQAARRLTEGGAVIVAREYLVARGLGVGSTFVCFDDKGQRHEFEVVGVVTSPGLEIIGDVFDIGEEFTEQRMHAVFGGLKDMRERFGNANINMIQVDLRDDVSDEEALEAMREAAFPWGVIDVGSGRQFKRELSRFVETTLVVSSSIAVFVMFVACFGVANLIVAGIQTRQFEFGVLRAVGASRSLLTRLVLAEALVVALAACALGTLMGVQGAFGGTQLNKVLWGLEITASPPPGPIAAGWGVVLLMTMGAAAPAVIALARKKPRDLLGAMKG